GDGPRFLVPERCGSARLVVVLDESDQFFLIRLIGAQMESHLLRGAMLQPIVQPLVVTVVEPLLLKFPLEIPIGFCNEQDPRISLAYGSDELDPKFPPWFLTRAGSPRPLDDRIHHEHGHI